MTTTRIKPVLDARAGLALRDALLARRAGYLPGWHPEGTRVDAGLIQVAASYAQTILRRLDRSLDRNELAFLDLLGIQLIPARAARAPIVFELAAGAQDSRVPAGTRVAAPPPPGGTDQLVFETERAVGLAGARLAQVFSLVPGRDGYIDHTPALAEKKPMRLFDPRALRTTPHAIYLAHDTLLALSGNTTVEVLFDLLEGASESIDLTWEYWDGKVWREFKSARRECDEVEARRLDGTEGLRHGGKVRLEADFAKSEKTTVNGIEAFWVRGRLADDRTLAPGAVAILPEVDQIKLQNETGHGLSLGHLGVTYNVDGADNAGVFQLQGVSLTVSITDADGAPQPGVPVRIDEGNGPRPGTTDATGSLTFTVAIPTNPAQMSMAVTIGATVPNTLDVPIDHEYPLTIDLSHKHLRSIPHTTLLDGVRLDKAFAGPDKIDLTGTLQPFGPQVVAGGAFYFTCEEVFSKPGASFKVGVAIAAPVQPVAKFQVLPDKVEHELAWEYYDGRDWKCVRSSKGDSGAGNTAAERFTKSGIIEGFVVHPDMAKVKVNGDEQLWMRVRVVNGSFGIIQQVQAAPPVKAFFPQPPALSDFRIGYVWKPAPEFPKHVITHNDFQYVDETETAKWPGKALKPFTPVDDITAALYLGFDRALPVDALSLYIDAEEQSAAGGGPAQVWEYWDGGGWQALAGVEDETRRLRSPGMLALIGPADGEALARFGTPLHWVRARLKEDEPPGVPVINAIHMNAVWASQNQTIVNEPLGASTGQTNQGFAFRQVPVLEGQVIEVRELAGRRADVEWRIVALDVLNGDERAVRDIEDMLAADGTPLEFEYGTLRFKRDRQKRVTEVWVRWEEPARGHMRFSASGDRHYTVDRARGRAAFGDGHRGRVPPVGAPILARRYRTGGGVAGNAAAEAINQVLGAVGAVEKVFNPRPAQGGADGELAETVLLRGPQTVRHRGRAVAGPDFATMAREAASSVAVTRAIPGRDPSGRRAPGWVTVVIIPQSAESRPWPSFGLREAVRRYIARHAAADLVAADRIYVTGPVYVPVDIDAEIAVRDASTAGAVEQAARGAIAAFLHPLSGGADGRGWQPGRAVYLSDVAAVLERVSGVDYAVSVALLRDGAVQGLSARVPEDGTVVAGDIRLKLRSSEA